MMKSVEDRLNGEPARPLDRPMARRILVQGRMCSEFVAIAGVGRKDPTQIEPHVEPAIGPRRIKSAQYTNLMPLHDDLGFQSCLRLEWRDHDVGSSLKNAIIAAQII